MRNNSAYCIQCNHAKISKNYTKSFIIRKKNICTVHFLMLYKEKSCTEHGVFFSILISSETLVTMTQDVTHLEAAEMRFLRSVKGYTRLDKIRSKVIRKELEISGIQDVEIQTQNWINHLERMDNTRLPKHSLNYKPRGRRDRGHPTKRWQCVDAGTGQTT